MTYSVLSFSCFRESQSSSKGPAFLFFCTLKCEWQIYPLLVGGNVGMRTISLKHIEILFSTSTLINFRENIMDLFHVASRKRVVLEVSAIQIQTII